MESGLVPELAVIAVFPSGLIVNPYGCGATTMFLPIGATIRPLGIIVLPDLSILTNLLSAGAIMIQGVLSSFGAQENRIKTVNNRKMMFALNLKRCIRKYRIFCDSVSARRQGLSLWPFDPTSDEKIAMFSNAPIFDSTLLKL